MGRHKKSPEELELELSEQVQALRASASTFDNGVEWEAKRLATSIYTLVHDGIGTRSKSLLGLVGKKGRVRYLSSLVLPENSGGRIVVTSAAPLLLQKVSSEGVRYVAPLGDTPLSNRFRWLAFNDWWEEKIFHPLSGVNLSRKNVVFSMRSQDGGAHVDDHLTSSEYHFFKHHGGPNERSAPSGITLYTSKEAAADSGLAPVLNGDRATMRQIAWELDQSLLQVGL